MEAFFEELFELSDEPEENISTGHFLVVVIYDIPDNKRRLKIAKLLSGYGKRVQKSAFECILTRKQYDTLVGKLIKAIQEEDLLRVYKIAGCADVKVWGDIALTQFEEDIII
jgi:CRISPR-associated protein Cas2